MEPPTFNEKPAGDGPPRDNARDDPSVAEANTAVMPARAKLNAGRFARLAQKELREILRDRRTIITLVLMPLLVYPMLSLVLQRALLNSNAAKRGMSEKIEFVVATEQRAAEGETSQWEMFVRVYDMTRLYQQQQEQNQKLRDDHDQTKAATLHESAGDDKSVDASDDSANEPLLATKLTPADVLFVPYERRRIVESDATDEATDHTEIPGEDSKQILIDHRNVEQLVADGVADIGVRIRRNGLKTDIFGFQGGAEIEFVYRQGSASSEEALRFLSDLFRFGNEDFLRNQLQQANASSVSLIDQKSTAIKSAPVQRTRTLATLLPLILTLMTITGAVYPAIDLTAGERERGTLETLIAAPIPRMGILMGKFIAVFTVAQLTAFVNMIGMMITIWAFQLDKLLFDEGITLLMVVEIMGLVALFAGFFSAILLAITSFARSFKEAQAYLIPVMLISMTPGLGALMPDLQLKGPLVVLPLINIVLLARDILQGEANLSIAIIAIASTVIYGALALTFAARIFGTDAVLFGNQKSIQSLFRPPRRVSETCSVPGAFLCLALLFPANFLWLGVLTRGDRTPSQRLLLMTVGTVLLFAIFPMAWAAFNRVRISTGLGLRRGRLIAYPAAVLLGCSLGVLLIQIYSSVDLISDFFAESQHASNETRKKLVQAAEQTVQTWRTMPPALVLIALSVVPAICEELFFRGLLLHSLLKRTHVVFAVIVTGLMFGLFHILSTNLLALERFLPTALMGMVLAIVCVQSQSVIPGMFLHALHNLILVSAAFYNDWLIANHWISPEQESLPLPLVIGAVVVSAIGFSCLFIAGPKPSEHKSDGH